MAGLWRGMAWTTVGMNASAIDWVLLFFVVGGFGRGYS